MRFVPVKFNAADFSIWDFDAGNAFQLSPPSTAMCFLQVVKDANARPNCNGLDGVNIPNDLEIHIHVSTQ
jgi:hypothetical protein